MVQIRHDGIEDFACPHCGAIYEISETPARDSGSAECEDCGTIMVEWFDSAIPLFRAKKSAENAKRPYFFSAQSRVAGK
jgi:transcription initiation factor TFIIIB Brf1 subunit/transcription initiation factor TFIIB